MKISKKSIATIEDLRQLAASLKKEGKSIVLVQGHFNVVHTGHIRFLEFAKQQGDYLIVAVHGQTRLDARFRDRFFSEEDRERSVASFEHVDSTIIFNKTNFEQILDAVRPDAYVRGSEHAKQRHLFQGEIDLVEKYGGKIYFSSGYIQESTSEFLDKDIVKIKDERNDLLDQALHRQEIKISRLKEILNNINSKKILVIGDTIVDQYVACDALGMSSESPTLVLKEISQRQYVGGAAFVARSIRALGADCHFITVLGKDEPAHYVSTILEKDAIKLGGVVEDARPTTFKIRYMVEQHRLLRVSRLEDQPIQLHSEEKIISQIEEMAPHLNAIVVSDFGYGLITSAILNKISEVAAKYKILLFGDAQSSSQTGNVLKFQNYSLITPTEKEARICLDDNFSGLEKLGYKLMEKSKCDSVLLTLSGKGFIAFAKTEFSEYLETQVFPALNPNPVDVVGAGDSLLSAMTCAIVAGGSLMEASVLGSGVAYLKVSRVGNIPVDKLSLIDWLDTIDHQ